MLKVYDRKKALFYLIPLTNGVKISMAIRETERDVFLRDDELEKLHEEISAAKRYTEGFALQFDITNKAECQSLKMFIGKLVTLRI